MSEEHKVTIPMPVDGSYPLLSIAHKRDVVENDDSFYVMVHDLSSHGVFDQLRTPAQVGELLALAARACADVLSTEKGNGNLSDQFLAEISEVFQRELIEEEYDKQ